MDNCEHVATTSPSHFAAPILEAAVALSGTLATLDVTHAVIGGIACALYGSPRATVDLDLVADVGPDDVRRVKARVVAVDDRFTLAGHTIHYGLHPFPIELLSTHTFVWPVPLRAACRQLETTRGRRVSVLAPAAIILSKSSRASRLLESTRPASIAKCQSDASDIEFLCSLLGPGDLGSMMELLPEAKRERAGASVRAMAGIVEALRRHMPA